MQYGQQCQQLLRLLLVNLSMFPFSMGAHAYDLFRAGGDWLLSEKFMNASMIRTSSNSSANRLIEMGLELEKIKGN